MLLDLPPEQGFVEVASTTGRLVVDFHSTESPTLGCDSQGSLPAGLNNPTPLGNYSPQAFVPTPHICPPMLSLEPNRQSVSQPPTRPTPGKVAREWLLGLC